jgi:cell division protein FtsW (lipid II flippase)
LKKSHALSLVRWIHTLIYLVMVAAIALLLFAGITGYRGAGLWISLGLLAIETIVFVGNGLKCPLTAIAVRYGAEKGYAFDTVLPERFTRYTFRVFGSLMGLGLLLVVLRWVGLLG